MSDTLRGVVVAHGDVAGAMVDAVARITGQRGDLIALTNADCSRDILVQRLVDAVGAGPAVVFVDMPAGSCLQAALIEVREHPGVRVVAGVNLPMLLDFVYHRDVTPDEAVRRAVEHGNQAIQSYPR